MMVVPLERLTHVQRAGPVTHMLAELANLQHISGLDGVVIGLVGKGQRYHAKVHQIVVVDTGK